jgi:DNA-binding transcriptional MerR regulator
MNTIKTQFSIKDIENLSGIKAHTIRIWEKRYQLFEPKRTDTNIRYYSIDNLKKILNVSLLVSKGLKISKVSSLSDEKMREEVILQITNSESSEGYENAVLMAMLNFDQSQFESIYNKLTAEFSFREIFNNLFIPLLYKIGLQWQSDTITPAHEHFITNLITQKLYLNIERVNQTEDVVNGKVFVLFLPEFEIHQLGLLFIQYELILKGYKAIYLGERVPIQSLESIYELHKDITFVSYFTVYPPVDKLNLYLKDFDKKYLQNGNKLIVGGRNAVNADLTKLKNINVYNNFAGLLKSI